MLALETHGEVLRLKMARTLFGKALHRVSAYWVDGLLVDAGPPPVAKALVELLQPRGVSAVAVTHHHEDHVGAAAEYLSRGVPVYAPAPALAMLRRGPALPLYRRLVWGRVEPFAAQPLEEELVHRGRRYRVISTPGHAHDHVVFYDQERRWIFGGDLFVHERVHSLRRIESVHRHLDSLRKVLALDPAPRRWFCAHAGVLEDPLPRVRAKIHFWEELEEQSWALLQQGLPPGAIARRLLGREGLLTMLSFGDFSKRNLIRDLLRGAPESRSGQGSGPLPEATEEPSASRRDMLDVPVAGSTVHP
ncbi:MAG: MBL fold metallo-hydrolase [Acidobacteriota bacterium]